MIVRFFLLTITILVLQTSTIEPNKSLRTFGVFNTMLVMMKNNSDSLFANKLAQFHHDIDKYQELELAKRRLRIYQDYLLKRVSGSIFKDFYGRF